MARAAKKLRYIVTRLDPEPSYADPGPALSRSLTAAERSETEGTWYVRDTITDATIGYSEVVLEKGVRITRTVRHKHR